jgi:hypothetical protein
MARVATDLRWILTAFPPRTLPAHPSPPLGTLAPIMATQSPITLLLAQTLNPSTREHSLAPKD